MGAISPPGHPYIESTTVLSDIYIFLSVTVRNAIYCGTFGPYGISGYTHDASNGSVANAVSSSS